MFLELVFFLIEIFYFLSWIKLIYSCGWNIEINYLPIIDYNQNRIKNLEISF